MGLQPILVRALTSVACLATLLAIFLPFSIGDQIAKDRAYDQQFRRAAAYAGAYAGRTGGRFPSDDSLRALGGDVDHRAIWQTLRIAKTGCPGLADDPADQFVLTFQRDEEEECFAYPSGASTLPMTFGNYVRSGWGVLWLGLVLLALLSAVGARWLSSRTSR
jgi:hypothetical protein